MTIQQMLEKMPQWMIAQWCRSVTHGVWYPYEEPKGDLIKRIRNLKFTMDHARAELLAERMLAGWEVYQEKQQKAMNHCREHTRRQATHFIQLSKQEKKE